MSRCCAGFVFGLAALLFTGHGAIGAERAAPWVRATVDAVFLEDGPGLQGEVFLEISNNTGVRISAIPLWLYPNRFAEPNPGLDDQTVKWVYPSGESPGRMTVWAPVWNQEPLAPDSIALEPMPARATPAGAQEMIARVTLPAPLEPGAKGTLAVCFLVEIPTRRGRFGTWDGVTALGGGWFPRPLADLTGRNTALPLETIRADVALGLPAGYGAVLGNRIFRPLDRPAKIRVGGIENQAVALVIMDKMDVSARELPWGKAIYVSQELHDRPPKWKDTRAAQGDLPTFLPGFLAQDVPQRALDVVENTARLLADRVAGVSLPGQIVLVEIPAWDKLVQAGPGPVLVSSSIWRILPIEAAMWFHDLALSRAVGAELVRSAVADQEPLVHRFIFGEMAGELLARRYSRQIHQSSFSVKEIIGVIAFMPSVDNLIYAPQNPFKEVFSQSIEIPDPLRDEPWRFMNRLPGGRRILGKLEDLIGIEQTEALVLDPIGSDQSLAQAIARKLGPEADRFFDQWFTDYPEVNYRLGEMAEDDLPGGRVRHSVEIIRQGAPVVEPVTVRLTDFDGQVKDLTWKSEQPRGRVEWISGARLKQAEIDPEHRLVESPDLTDGHPLADNAKTLAWRPPLLSRILIWGDPVAGEPYVVATVGMRRRYDITNSYWLDGHYTPRGFGGLLAYRRGFGPKVTLNERSWFWGPSLSVDRYRKVEEPGPELPEDTLFGATMGSVSLIVGRDDRAFFADPRTGLAFWLSGSYSFGKADDDHAVQVGGVSGRVFGLFSPAIRHTFALYGGGKVLWGEPVAADLATLSERQILRGFELNETYGRVGLYAVAEYRHTLFDGSAIPIPLYSWFDRFQGVLFAGAGTASWPSGYDGLFTRDRIFTEVGYGLRAHIIAYGAHQYLLAVDVAFPLTPTERQIQTESDQGATVFEDRPLFKLILGVTQTF